MELIRSETSVKTEPWGTSQVLFRGDSGNTEIGLFKCSPGRSMDMHKHDGADELIYVLKGRASFEDEQGIKHADEGEAVFIARNVLHKAFNENAKDYWCLYIVSPLK